MQRLIIFLVAAVLSFVAAMAASSLTGTSATTTAANAPALQVGFANRDITPETGKDKPPVYMAGFGHNRVAEGVNDPLYAHAVVLIDGTNKIALLSLDIVGLFYPNALHIRSALPGFTGVIVSSTHNHEGPDTLGLWGQSPVKNGINQEYLKRVENEAIAAVKEAEQSSPPSRPASAKPMPRSCSTIPVNPTSFMTSSMCSSSTMLPARPGVSS